MNHDRLRSSRWLIRAITAALSACILWRSARELRDAYHYQSSALAFVYIILFVTLVGTWCFAEATVRNGSSIASRRGLVVLVVACTFATASGNSPGAFASSPLLSALSIGAVALIAGLLSGAPGTLPARVAVVLFSGAVGAAWQAAAAPFVATLLVRN